MKYILLSLLIVSINQNSNSQCDSSRGYRFGANMNQLYPFWGSSAIIPSASDYSMYYSDITQFNDNYHISSTSQFFIRNPNSLRKDTYMMFFPKLHIRNSFLNTFRDVKYQRIFQDKIYSHTDLDNGRIILSGTSQELKPNTSMYGKGTITETDINGTSNEVKLTENGIYSNFAIDPADIILKTVVENGVTYAFGYKILDPGANKYRVGILYVIDNAILQSKNNRTNCTNDRSQNTGVRLFRIQSIVTDLLVNSDGSIIVCGSKDVFRGTRGFIARINLANNNFRMVEFRADPFAPPPTTNNSIIFNYLKRGNNPNQIYALYRNAGHFAPYGALGFYSINENLDSIYSRQFNIDLGPGAISTIPGWVDMFPSNIEVDDSENLYIGSYIKDYSCLTGAITSNCLYRHLTVFYNKNFQDLNPSPSRWIQNSVGFADFGFTNLDKDPFNVLGSAINSATTLNKIPRTVVLNSTKDTIHIAYLLKDNLNSDKSTTYHYKRHIGMYPDLMMGQFNECIGNICTREPFEASVDSPSMKSGGPDPSSIMHHRFQDTKLDTIIYVDDLNNFDSIYKLTDIFEVKSCNLSNTSIGGYWHEEYPVLCKNPVYDDSVGCAFWKGIRIKSNKDRFCKYQTSDSLFLEYLSPLGINHFVWTMGNNPNAIISNEKDIEITSPGTYQVICTRELSDGSTCSDTFSQTIHSPYNDEITANPDPACIGQMVDLTVSNTDINTYEWRKWNGATSTLLGSGIVTLPGTSPILPKIKVNSSGVYSIYLNYENGCKDTLKIDQYYQDLSLKQTITETGSSNEELQIEVCNHSNYDFNNVKINTSLSNNIVNTSLVGTNWTLNLGSYEYMIPLLNAATSPYSPTCTIIKMPVKVNKCNTDLTISANTITPSYSCGLKIDTKTYWQNSNFTPTLTSNKTTACNGENIQVTASPTGASNYKWYDNNVLLSTPGNTHTGNINYDVSREIYSTQIDVDITNNQCKKRASKSLNFSPTLSHNSSITNISCNSPIGNQLGEIDFVPIPSSPPNTYTYKWNDASASTTEDLANLDFMTNTKLYTVTATDINTCTASFSFTVNNNINIDITTEQKLINCATGDMEYTISPTIGSVLDYTYSCVDNLNATVPMVGNKFTGSKSSYTVTLTDMVTNCSRSFEVKSNLTSITASSTIQLDNLPNQTNQVLLLSGNLSLTKGLTLINCDVFFTTPQTQLTIKSQSSTNQAGLRIENSRFKTCGNFLARGIVMTKTGDYVYPTNSTFEDMFAAIAIEPDLASGQGSGTFFLPMTNNTFRNNYTGVRIDAPSANIVQNSTKLFATPSFYLITDFCANNLFTANSSFKPNISSSILPAEIANLEYPLTTANTSSPYTGFMSNNSGVFSFSNIPPVGGTILPNFFENMANGVLKLNGELNLINCKFTNLVSTNVNLLHKGFAVFGKGNASSNDKIKILGYNTWTNDISNTLKAVYTEDMNLHIGNLKVSSDEAIKVTRTTGSNVNTTIFNNNLSSKQPILIQGYSDDIIKISDNIISDQNSSNNTGALIDISGSASLAANSNNKITNNTLTINYKRFGIRMNSIQGFSASNRYLIADNIIKILNPTTTFTYAGIQISNTFNYNLTGNTIHQSYSSIPTSTGTISSIFAGLTTSVMPIGIWTDDISDLKLSCNNLYTQTGTFHNNPHLNFDLVTNNYVTKDYGILFNNLNAASSTIPGLSNKFYCGVPSSNFMFNISPNFANRVTASYGGLSATYPDPLPTTCAPPAPFCEMSPPSPLPVSYYPSILSTRFILTTAPSLNQSCILYCNLPKMSRGNSPSLIGSSEPSCSLYPNPSQGRFNIEFENINPEITAIHLSILDIQGRVVYQVNALPLKSSKAEIDTKLIVGNYFVRINHASGLQLVKKLTIE